MHGTPFRSLDKPGVILLALRNEVPDLIPVSLPAKRFQRDVEIFQLARKSMGCGGLPGLPFPGIGRDQPGGVASLPMGGQMTLQRARARADLKRQNVAPFCRELGCRVRAAIV